MRSLKYCLFPDFGLHPQPQVCQEGSRHHEENCDWFNGEHSHHRGNTAHIHTRPNHRDSTITAGQKVGPNLNIQ